MDRSNPSIEESGERRIGEGFPSNSLRKIFSDSSLESHLLSRFNSIPLTDKLFIRLTESKIGFILTYQQVDFELIGLIFNSISDDFSSKASLKNLLNRFNLSGLNLKMDENKCVACLPVQISKVFEAASFCRTNSNGLTVTQTVPVVEFN